MRILVVDDEREHGFLLFRILERMGHEPVLAFDPRDALDILRDDRGATVAGVITDVDMPGMTGIDLARRIREDVGADIPVAFCTGSCDGNVADAAASIGPIVPKGQPLARTRALIEETVTMWCRPRR